MKKRMILFSIGSVQDFIINSRKVCDLSNSSKILSLLINKGIEFIVNKKGKVVLPVMEEGTENTPNYFIMIYENCKSLGKEVEDCVRSVYKQMATKIGYLKQRDKDKINMQLDSSLDIYWVDYELSQDFDINNSEQYSSVYYELYEYLEAVKNVRKFSPIYETEKKCSICGCRDSIPIYKESKSLKKGEHLCAVCLLKRFFKDTEKNKFNSLAYIALSNIIKNDENIEKYISYIAKKCGDLDKYECAYIENWGEFLSKYDDAKKIIYKSQFQNFINLDCINKLPKYYCLYRMDIDNLGKWMNGKYSENVENLYKYQKNLSQRINKFFQSVRNEIDDDGLNDRVNIIYAGGDDIMALLPVDCIYEFENIINKKFNSIVKQGEFRDITYSQGIFVAHYKTVLGEVVRVSKDILELTKKRFQGKFNSYKGEKDATVISILTEGYNNVSVYFKNNMKRQRTIDFVYKDLMEYLKKDKSTYFHAELESKFLYMFNELEKYDIEDRYMFETEQKRLMKRSAVDKEYVSKKMDKINSKLLNFLIIGNKEETSDFNNYFNLFYVIRKLKQNMTEEKDDKETKG